MANDAVVDESAPRNFCRFCNKVAVNKIVRCTKCSGILHRYCCEKKNIEVAIDNTTLCCLSEARSSQDTPGVDAELKQTKIDPKPLCGKDQGRTEGESGLRMEITFLKALLAEKEKIIFDKCVIIGDKHRIIQLQQQELERLKTIVGEVNSVRSVIPPKSESHTQGSDGDNDISMRTHRRNGGDEGANSGAKTTGNRENRSAERGPRGGGNVDGTPLAASMPLNGQMTDDRHDVTVSDDGTKDSRLSQSTNDNLNTRRWENVNKSDPKTRTRERAKMVVGTAERLRSGTGTAFAGVEQRAWMYVGRVSAEVTVESVKSYLGDKFPGKLFEVEKLTKREDANSVAFKIGAEMGLLGELNQAETWPRGVQVRRYRFFQRRKQPEET